MNYEFRNDITTNIPTCCLVEDVQLLLDGLNRGDMECIRVAAECLMEALDRYTTVPDSLNIKPSASSVVAMGCKSGIIMSGTQDLECAAGNPVSHAMDGGVCQCDNTCPYYGTSCQPENVVIMLEGGAIYNGRSESKEDVLASLDAYQKP